MARIIAGTDNAGDIARRLLEAAEDPSQISTTTDDGLAFLVPDEIAVAAGFPIGDEDEDTGPAAAAEIPARNASKAAWSAFLDAQNPPVTYAEGAGRDDLVAAWDAHSATTTD